MFPLALQSFPVAHFQVPSGSGSQPSTITRVKATATVKVEVHTPIPGQYTKPVFVGVSL